MKILILANDCTGLFKFRKELIEKLIEHNHKLYISVPAGMLIHDIRAMGCKVAINHHMERRGTSVRKDFNLIQYYVWLLRETRPDVVLTYTIKPNAYGGMACSLLGVPYIANITGLGTSIENKGLLRAVALLAYRLGLKKAKKVFFQNEENRNHMLDAHVVKEGQSERIPGSGVNIHQHCYEPYPESDGPVVFTTIGRIMKDKGIDEILEAAKNVKKNYPYTVFRLIGDFDERYEDEVRRYEELGILTYIPQQKEIHPYITGSHAILHASHHEGMSNVLLEAASTGRPVIATDVPGCIDAFEPDITGIAFQAGDTGSLVQALERFLALSHEEKEAMGKAGRRKMEREFNRDRVVNRYMEEIEKISGKKTEEK